MIAVECFDTNQETPFPFRTLTDTATTMAQPFVAVDRAASALSVCGSAPAHRAIRIPPLLVRQLEPEPSAKWIMMAESVHSARTEPIVNLDYFVTLERIRELDDELEYPDEVTRPTEFALRQAIQLIEEAALSVGWSFPRGSASVSHDGGLRVTWACLGRQVRLIIGAQLTDERYIYYEAEDGYGLARVTGPPALAAYLMWVSHTL